MCGRYGLFTPVPALERRFDVRIESPIPRTYNAAPGEALPIVPADAPDRIRTAEWGLVPHWADDAGDHGHVNARAETLWERPSFRAAAQRRRCLVPADGFYEWGAPDGQRRPYFVRRADGEPFAMAGLYERVTPATSQAALDAFGSADRDPTPDVVETFTIITTEPNATVEPVHDRMPVVLPRERERAWLTGSGEANRDLLAPAPAETLEIHPVSHAVDDPAADGPELVAPVDG